MYASDIMLFWAIDPLAIRGIFPTTLSNLLIYLPSPLTLLGVTVLSFYLHEATSKRIDIKQAGQLRLKRLRYVFAIVSAALLVGVVVAALIQDSSASRSVQLSVSIFLILIGLVAVTAGAYYVAIGVRVIRLQNRFPSGHRTQRLKVRLYPTDIVAKCSYNVLIPVLFISIMQMLRLVIVVGLLIILFGILHLGGGASTSITTRSSVTTVNTVLGYFMGATLAHVSALGVSLAHTLSFTPKSGKPGSSASNVASSKASATRGWSAAATYGSQSTNNV
jgi:hypothetical protein